MIFDKRYKILVSGFVQGVGYRRWVKDWADKLGLKGWVKNTLDGKVEILVEGPENKIQELLEKCKEGPSLAKVEKVEILGKEDPKFDLKDFEIKQFGF